VVSRELVAEAVEQGLPVEEGVGAPYRRPLRRRPPAQDPDQRSLVRSPSCINQWKRGRRVSFATQQRKETDKIKMVMGSWLGCEMQCIALERLPQALGVLGGRRRRARHGDGGHGCRSFNGNGGEKVRSEHVSGDRIYSYITDQEKSE